MAAWFTKKPRISTVSRGADSLRQQPSRMQGLWAKCEELRRDHLPAGAREEPERLPALRPPHAVAGARPAGGAARPGHLRGVRHASWSRRTRSGSPTQEVQGPAQVHAQERWARTTPSSPAWAASRATRSPSAASSSSSWAARWARWSARRSRASSSARIELDVPGDRVLRLGRRAHAGGHLLADADGEDLRGASPASARRACRTSRCCCTRPPAAWRPRFALLGDVILAEPKALIGFAGPARDRADHPPEAARGLPALRVPARARHDRRHRPPQGPAREARRSSSGLLG